MEVVTDWSLLGCEAKANFTKLVFDKRGFA